MIITPHPYGRLANRLVLAAHWIAHVEEYGEEYLHLCFADYARFFEGTKLNAFVFYQSTRYFPHKRTSLVDFVNIINSHDRMNLQYDLFDPDFIRCQERTRLLFTLGWGFRDFPALAKHRDKIVPIFRPVVKHRDAIARCIDAARNGADHLVGIHMRQADYQKFNGGKWFYPASVYRRIMVEIASQLQGHTRFLICTDGELDAAAFQDLDIVVGTGHPVDDNYELAQCDYLFGPPSTYSTWAAFYGNVPLIHIETADQKIQLPTRKPHGEER